jgi:glycosyltransferase involved in cell wall biosynthesis
VHKLANHTLVPTEIIQKQLKDKYNLDSITWPRGVNTDIFYPKQDGEVNPFDSIPRCKGKYILYTACRIDLEKNLPILFDIDQKDLDRAVGRETQRVAFGNGPYLEMYKDKYKDTLFMGKLDQNNLAYWARHADQHELTSFNDTWAQENSEAASMNVPTAGWRGKTETGKPISSAASIIEGQTGFTGDYGTDSFLDIISRVAKNDWENCSTVARENFSREKAFMTLLLNSEFISK